MKTCPFIFLQYEVPEKANGFMDKFWKHFKSDDDGNYTSISLSYNVVMPTVDAIQLLVDKLGEHIPLLMLIISHANAMFTVDFVSAPFCVSKSHIYEGIENCDTFFRPALRSLLVSRLSDLKEVHD